MVGESDFQTWLSISSISIDSAITAAGNFAMNWRVKILILKDIKSVRRRGEGVGLRTYLHFAHFGAFGVDQKDRMTKSF